MPKTGSSAIQAFLALNSKYLQGNDFIFPWHPGFGQAYQTSAGNAPQLHNWITQGDDSVFKAKLNEIKESNVVLSSEVLFHTCRLAPKKFADFFSEFDIKIICYVRRIDNLLESCINQMVKNHGLVEYSDIGNILADHDYASTLLELNKYIDKHKIIVRPYDKKQFKDGNIYSDFLDCIGLDLIDQGGITYPDKTVNPSLNRDAFEFRRFLNSLDKLNDKDELKYRINGILAKYSVKNNGNNYQILNSENKKKINNMFGSNFSEFSRTFFEGKNKFANIGEHEKRKYEGLSHKKITEILIFIFNEDEDIFKLILDYFMMSRPEKVIYYFCFLGALRQDFFYSLYKIKCENSTELRDNLFTSYAASLLNPEKTILSFNFKQHLFDYSEHVTSIEDYAQGFNLISSGNDPYFCISPIESSSRRIYSVMLGVDAPSDTILQLHYQTESEPYFGNNKFFNRKIYSGQNKVAFNVLIEDFNGFFRIDPGTTDGSYFFSYIIIFSDFVDNAIQHDISGSSNFC